MTSALVLSGLLLASSLSAPDLAGPHGPGSSGSSAAAPFRWGETGHEMAARAAAETLPSDLPSFFRDAGEQLVYLDPEPDRWRSRPLREMDQAWSYDHYIDLENVPEGALDRGDRWTYLKALYDARLPKPERDGGFLPFRIVEMYQRLVTEWRLWRAESDPERKAWIQERIVNDAGILGHYVADAANPHHTTIHFNGWNEDAPNPQGYTMDRDFHWRFESLFVNAHVRFDDVRSRVVEEPRSVAGEARSAVLEHIMEAHALVETMYRLEKDVGFDPDAALDPRTRDFAAGRVAAGGRMLRDLWWSAWLESAQEP